MKRKSETIACFIIWLVMEERHTNLKLKANHSDNGGEYISKEFNDFITSRVIRQDPTVPYNPHQNGIVERMNRTLE